MGRAPEPDRPLLEVGRVVRAHGIRGEVVVEAISNRPERFAAGSVLMTGDGHRLAVIRGRPKGGPVSSASTVRGRWIVAFEGVGDRDHAEALRGTELFAEPVPGDPEKLWVHDLVGAEVTDRKGSVLGRVSAVEANPASDLLVLDGGALVPLVFVVDSAPGRVVVDPPEGLFDL